MSTLILCSLNSIESKWTGLSRWYRVCFFTFSRKFLCLPCCTCDKSVPCQFVYKNLNSMFCSKMHNFALILKIFPGCIAQAFSHPWVKYLSDWMILKFSHKLTYNYLNLTNINGLQKYSHRYLTWYMVKIIF